MNQLNNLPFDKELISLIKQYGIIKNYAKGDNFFCEKESAGFSTFLISGSLKLFIKQNNKRIFLYCIYGNEICITSFSGLFEEYPVDFYSEVLEDSTILSIPVDKLVEWSMQYPKFRDIITYSYQKHYSTLLGVIKELTEDSLETRLYNYLRLKSVHYNSLNIPISHKQIASDLNFTRESIGRVLKKLEFQNKLRRNTRSITLFST